MTKKTSKEDDEGIITAKQTLIIGIISAIVAIFVYYETNNMGAGIISGWITGFMLFVGILFINDDLF